MKESQTYCKSLWRSSTVESIEIGTVLSVSVTVTAASLLTGVDMWSERSAGGRLALWPCSPQAWPWCPLADVTYWSRLSSRVTACYPPHPCSSSAGSCTWTQRHKLRLQCLLSCCCSSPSLHPHYLRPWGDSLTDLSSSALTNDWHHQPPIHSAPLHGRWVYGKEQQLDRRWRKEDGMCLWL